MSQENNSEHIKLPRDGGWDTVPISHILYIKSDKKLCTVVTAGSRYVLFASLRKFERMLPQTRFQRVHKRYLVSLHYILHIDKGDVTVGQHKIPLSRMRKPELNKKYLRYRGK